MRTFGLAEFLLILAAVRWTILLSVVALVGGGILGFVVAILRTHRSRILRMLTAGYIQAFQGTPVLMQLFLFYYGFAVLFDIQIDAWPAVALAFTLYSSAFLGEIWRGSIEAIPKTQWEASACLSLFRFPATASSSFPAAADLQSAACRLPHSSAGEGDVDRRDRRLRRADPSWATHGERDIPANGDLPAGRGHLLCDVLATFTAQSLTREAHRCRSWNYAASLSASAGTSRWTTSR